MPNEPEPLLEALLIVWDELPPLLGRDWPKVYHRLEQVLARLEAEDAADSPEWLDAALEEVFRGHADAQARWRTAARGAGTAPPVRLRGGGPATTPPQTTVRTRGARRSAPATRHTAGADAKALAGQLRQRLRRTVARYPDISCPERVAFRTPRLSVVVRLKVRPFDPSAATPQVAVEQQHPVLVYLEAPAFVMLNEPIQEIVIRPDGDSPPVVFDLKPRQVGHSHLNFEFFQQGCSVGSARVPIECTAGDVAAVETLPEPQALRLGSQPTSPDLVLVISTHLCSSTLEFTLLREGGASFRTFSPVPLRGSPADYAADLYRTFTGLTVRSDPAAAALGETRSQLLAGLEIDDWVRALGHNLWKELIPQDLKEVYAAGRPWHGRSLLIFSDDPHLPWELVWPWGPGWADELPWCGTFDLTRWLRRDAQHNGNESPPLRLALRSLAVLAPADAGLPSAKQEKKSLLDLARKHQVTGASPRANLAGMMQLLRQGEHDWVHVAAHGRFHAPSPDGVTALLLEDRAAFVPAMIVGPEVGDYLRRRRPAFLFNACEVGQLGRGLTGLAGWAARLVSGGAGFFAGPLWEISDEGGLAFATALYEGLLAGQTVAAAVRQARLKARREGDPTWLAYTVYAHPNARVANGPAVG
jgi:hypothetical protein